MYSFRRFDHRGGSPRPDGRRYASIQHVLGPDQLPLSATGAIATQLAEYGALDFGARAGKDLSVSPALDHQLQVALGCGPVQFRGR